VKDETVRMAGGRLFHDRDAETGKARSPRVDRCTDGTTSVMVVNPGLPGKWSLKNFVCVRACVMHASQDRPSDSILSLFFTHLAKKVTSLSLTYKIQCEYH